MEAMKNARRALVALPLAAMGGLASAATDVTSLVTDIGGEKTSISTIGVAILGVIVAAAVFMWLRKVIR